ncbi:hypothetical protein [Rhizobium sp. RU36D]|uniref:hypothetical protein n=1 Tax=Rhizobium sp. RU36D TaxID=1907415 RepID=UPI0009D87583|nr:hypothetical protein [Rhizobium sp. RU36D]SMD15950.1 hypothetical protein SAMN05880593_12859 [Rhizobium sp. RU36D]
MTLRYLIILASFVLISIAVFFHIKNVETIFFINKNDIKFDSGNLYLAPIPVQENVFITYKDEANGALNRLILMENGRALGPAATSHDVIRKEGQGRFSHWQGHVWFSTVDGSNPKTNSYTYTGVIKGEIRLPFLIAYWVGIAVTIFVFVRFISPSFIQHKRPSTPVLTLVDYIVLLVFLTAEAIFLFNLVNRSDWLFTPPKASGLALSLLWHSLLGLLVAILPFFLGAGLLRWLRAFRVLNLHAQIVASFPFGLLVLMGMVFTLLTFSFTWPGALLLIVFAGIGWMKGEGQAPHLKEYVGLVLFVFPFAALLAGWFGMNWHGPYAGQDGYASGDLTFYANDAWAMAGLGFPIPQLAVEGEIAGGFIFANKLFPALAALGLRTAEIDPYLFILTGTAMTYCVGLAIITTAFFKDMASKGLPLKHLLVLGLAILGAGRYPYWMAESPPVPHSLVVSVSVVWFLIKSLQNRNLALAGLASSLVSSMAGKVVSVSALGPLAIAAVFDEIMRGSRMFRWACIILCAAGSLYACGMLYFYLPTFIKVAPAGPETYLQAVVNGQPLQVTYPYILRDASLFILSFACWRLFPWTIAAALTLGFLTFFLFQFLFHINFATSLLAIGFLVAAWPQQLQSGRKTLLLGLIMALPAMMLTDVTGKVTGLIWLVTIAGLLGAVYTFCLQNVQQRNIGRSILIVSSTSLAVFLAIMGFAVENRTLSFAAQDITLPYAATDIWRDVRERTPADALIFTDQTSAVDTNQIGGWNTVALSGQRQIFVANWVQSSLRVDLDARAKRFGDNEAVLSGKIAPDAVPLSRHYRDYFAVVSAKRVMPLEWEEVHRNNAWVIYRWAGS